jgi:hypothetical protein
MMSKKIKVTDITTLHEMDKKWLYEGYTRGLDKDGLPDDALIKFYEDRFPGLIQEMTTKQASEFPRKVDDSDADDLFEHYYRAPTNDELEEMERGNQEYDDEERKNYQLYDPGSGQKILYPDCIKKYGRSLTGKMFIADNKNSGTVDKETWQQIQDIHKKNKQPVGKAKKPTAKVVIKPEPQIVVQDAVVEPEVLIQKVREAGDDYYMRLERGVIRNQSYKDLFKPAGRSVLYEHLWTNIAREGWNDKSGYPIKERYYNNGYLAYCSSIRKLGDDCCLDKKTVKKCLDAFKEAGVIKLEHIIPEGRTYGQSVAILGEWRSIGQDGNFKICERYYRDEVFLAPAPDVPFQFKK